MDFRATMYRGIPRIRAMAWTRGIPLVSAAIRISVSAGTFLASSAAVFSTISVSPRITNPAMARESEMLITGRDRFTPATSSS